MDGKISVTEEFISVSYSAGASWELPTSEVALVGEYTTETGPLADDHFVCIVDWNGICYDIGDEEGARELLGGLSRVLEVVLEPRLLLETEFKSCILHPPNACGKPLFRSPTPPRGLLERIRAFFGSVPHVLQLSSEAEQICAQKSKGGKD